ncbi:MAG TPA: OmpA family protein [Bacteroidales bacterium]|nr:OmpA family protein [Bacteroidales bacterium]HRZ48601.1 OmpA family protein [Bacteroidales bacterium]
MPVSNIHYNRFPSTTAFIRAMCFVFLAGSVPGFSQNLVSNPGFELYKVCPEKYNTTLVKHYEICNRWYTVSEASPDYFNTCSKSDKVSVPRNFTGNMKPHGGNGYIGLILKSDRAYYPGDSSYTEHIQNKLTSTLKKDRYYCFEIWIVLGKTSTIAAQDFGVYFSREQITFPNPPDSLPKPHLQYTGQVLKNSIKWVQLRGLYKAAGGEKYLTIGNFQPWIPGRFERLRTSFATNDLKEFAYYLFDDVSLIEVKDSSKCACNMITVEPVEKPQPEAALKPVEKKETEPVNEFEKAVVGEAIVLKNIFFAFDKSDLLPASYPELDKLVALMKKYPTMRIEIAGHTDYKGSVEYNVKLSNDRANSVVQYLIGQGIPASRLTWIGHGKSKPIADNTTEEGRQLNRRVEFTILNK